MLCLPMISPSPHAPMPPKTLCKLANAVLLFKQSLPACYHDSPCAYLHKHLLVLSSLCMDLPLATSTPESFVLALCPSHSPLKATAAISPASGPVALPPTRPHPPEIDHCLHLHCAAALGNPIASHRIATGQIDATDASLSTRRVSLAIVITPIFISMASHQFVLMAFCI